MLTSKIAALAACVLVAGASLAHAQSMSSPSADPAAPANPAIKSASDTTSGPLAKGHNSFTKGQAKSRIEKAGYTDVADLDLDADGLWQATATRDGQSVHVALDYKGTVAAQ
jgi:hypothetical protein